MLHDVICSGHALCEGPRSLHPGSRPSLTPDSMQETGEQLDIDEYDHMVFRVHGDGRKYIANLRTENWLVGGRSHDVWQAFLFAR